MSDRPDTQELRGILYFHRITDTRMDGGAIRCVQLFKDICGTSFLENTALITTMWDKYPEEDHATKETEQDLINQYWRNHLTVRQYPDGAGAVDVLLNENKEVVKLDTDTTDRKHCTGAMYARSDNTKEMFENILRRIVSKGAIMPQLQEELSRGTRLDETTAGKRLKRELDEKKSLVESIQRTIDEVDRTEGEGVASVENVPTNRIQVVETITAERVEGEMVPAAEIVPHITPRETEPVGKGQIVSLIMSISNIREDVG